MTDNLYEFRNYILEYLSERGYKYIARDSTGELFAYSRKPVKKGCDFDIDTDGGAAEIISIVSRIFTDIEWEDENPFEIKYTNWDSVPIDTKVIVTGVDGSEWNCHFCKKLNDNAILVFRYGKTSWTANDVGEVVEVDINNVRLA